MTESETLKMLTQVTLDSYQIFGIDLEDENRRQRFHHELYCRAFGFDPNARDSEPNIAGALTCRALRREFDPLSLSESFHYLVCAAFKINPEDFDARSKMREALNREASMRELDLDDGADKRKLQHILTYRAFGFDPDDDETSLAEVHRVVECMAFGVDPASKDWEIQLMLKMLCAAFKVDSDGLDVWLNLAGTVRELVPKNA